MRTLSSENLKGRITWEYRHWFEDNFKTDNKVTGCLYENRNLCGPGQIQWRALENRFRKCWGKQLPASWAGSYCSVKSVYYWHSMNTNFRTNLKIRSNRATSRQEAGSNRTALLAFLLDTCLAYSSKLRMEAECSFETSRMSSRTHGGTSQKMVLRILTALRTSNPTELKNLTI
jgi:hypothetical protein